MYLGRHSGVNGNWSVPNLSAVISRWLMVLIKEDPVEIMSTDLFNTGETCDISGSSDS